MIAVLSLAGYVLSVAASAPPLDSLKPIDQGTSSAVYAADGTRLGFIQSDEIRTPIPLQRIPESMQAATIAIEDERFYRHGGVDYEGIVRAAFKNLEAGKAVEGGSTITQQLVRNLYVGRERTLRAQDPRGAPGRGAGGPATPSAGSCESYLNSVAVRHGGRPDRGRRAGRRADVLRQAGQEPHARGVGAARRAAAGAERAEPVPEPARRARAAQQGARRRWPSSATSPTRARSEARRAPLGVRRGDLYIKIREPFFFDYVKQQLIDRFGVNTVRKGGLKVYTTIDPKLQKAGREAIDSTLPYPGDPSSAVVAIDPRTGYIRAMASSSQVQAQPVQPRRPGPPPARLGVQDLRAHDRDQARRQPVLDQLRVASRST